MAGVAEVVGVDAPGQRRRGLRLGGDHPVVGLAAELAPDERERQPGEVRATAGAADDHVGILACHLHLLERLVPDHRLVQQDVVEHRAQRVLGVVAGRGVLDRLRDRHAQGAGRVRGRGEHRASVVRLGARARDHLRAVGLHQDPAVRLLVVARADHVDLDLEPEHRARERQRAPPLAGAGLRRQPLDALLLVVERLRDRRVRLVAAGRADALVLVVDVRGRIERLLEAARAVQRRWAVQHVRLADRVRDLDLALAADLLDDQRHREQRREVAGADRLVRARVERRAERRRQVGRDVVPGPRDPRFVEDELGPLGKDAGHRGPPGVLAVGRGA